MRAAGFVPAFIPSAVSAPITWTTPALSSHSSFALSSLGAVLVMGWLLSVS